MDMLESFWQANFTIHRLIINVSVLLGRMLALSCLSFSVQDLKGTILTFSQNDISYDVHIMEEFNMDYLNYHFIEVLGELHNKDANVPFQQVSLICRIYGSMASSFEVFAISIFSFIVWLFLDCKSFYYQRVTQILLESCLFSKNSVDLLFFSFQSDSFQMYLSK